MSAIVLSIRGLRKSFARGLARCASRTLAVTDVDLDLYRSEIVGVTGAPGAGKTTLLQCAAGLLRPDSGSVIVRHSDDTSSALSVAYVPAVPIYYPFLTVRDVVSIRAVRNSRGAPDCDEALSLVELYDMRSELIAALAPSDFIRLSIAEALTRNPIAVMIDTNGSMSAIDHVVVQRTLQRVAATGRGVMVAARDHRVLEAVSTRIVQLSEGCLVRKPLAPLFVAERLH